MSETPIDTEPYKLSLVDALSEFVCNYKHGGIDVWAMLDGQEGRKNHWRPEALHFLKHLHAHLQRERIEKFGSAE